MPIITLTAASGSRGVTTLAVALATTWPRPVTLVEADPSGGSSILAGYFQGTVDQPGLIHLAMAHRQGQLGAVLPSLLMPIEGTQARLLAGTRSHDQAIGLEGVWAPLLGVLRDVMDSTGQDVIVDAGRLGLDGSPMPLILGSDATVIVVGSSLPAVAGARSWLSSLGNRAAAPVSAVVVGEGRPYRAREIAAGLGVPVVGSVEWAPDHAAVFSEGAGYPRARGLGRMRGALATREQFARAPFMRSVMTVGESLRRLAGAVPSPEPVRAHATDGEGLR